MGVEGDQELIFSEKTDSGILGEGAQHTVATDFEAEGVERHGSLDRTVACAGSGIGEGAAGLNTVFDLDKFLRRGRRFGFGCGDADDGPGPVGSLRRCGARYELKHETKPGVRVDEDLL